MNQTNQEPTAIIAYKIGVLALLISAIFLTFSYLGVGFTTHDETLYDLIERGEGLNLSVLAKIVTWQGRIQHFIGFFWEFFPYWIARNFGHISLNLIYLLSIFTSFALLAVTVYKVTQQKNLGLLVAVFSIVAIQNSWEHNALTTYTVTTNFSIILLLCSLILFLQHLSTGKKSLLVFSAVIFLFNLFASFEFFFLYVVIFVFIAFYNAQITTTSNRFVSTLCTSSLHLIAVMLFLSAYFIVKQFYPGSYDGSQIVAKFSLYKVLQVIYQYTVSSFPTYIYFHYSSLFNTYSDLTQGHSYTVYNFIAQLQAEWLVKSIVVSYFVYLLLYHRLIAISNKMFMGLVVVSIYAMVVPNILVSITDKYQQWVAAGSLQNTTTYFSYFGTVLLIISGIVFFNQFFYSNDLNIKIWRRLYVYLITMAIAFMSLVTDYSNYYVFKEQKISQQKWVVLETLVQSGNLDSIAAGSFIYAPSLWNHRGIVANHLNYWTDYLNLKYKKAITVSNSVEELNARLAQQKFNNLYYLKFSQEQKDMQQFILFAKVQKVVNDVIFLAADAVIVSNSNRKNFIVFGRSLPINVDAPLVQNAAIVVDDGATQRDGNFFSTQVNKPQVTGSYTTTHLKTVGDAGVDLESVSISSYTDHKLYKFDRTECFKLDVVFNLNQLSNLSCDLKNIFPRGWYGLEPWGIWSAAGAEMQIDLPKDCQDTTGCELKLNLPHAGVFNASVAKPKQVAVTINNKLIKNWIFNSWGVGDHSINIPLDAKTLQGKFKNIKIQFNIPAAESPKQVGMSEDVRILGMGLSVYQLVKRNAN